jgi:hypothetical protein
MTELALLRNFAATARRGGFGPPGFRMDGTTGEYRWIGSKTGKMNGRRLAATVADVLVGFQRIEKGKSPIYIVGRVSDGYTPPAREELGDTDLEKDPWTLASWLPCWDPETFETLLFHAPNDGSRNAVANLTEAYVDYREAHPDQANYDPLIELNADHYDGQHRRIYFPILDVLDWIERPTSLRRVLPPPVKALDLAALPAPAPAPSPSIPTKQSTRSPGLDDEIPFAPEWRG